MGVPFAFKYPADGVILLQVCCFERDLRQRMAVRSGTARPPGATMDAPAVDRQRTLAGASYKAKACP